MVGPVAVADGEAPVVVAVVALVDAAVVELEGVAPY